jgi:hypothetical protein
MSGLSFEVCALLMMGSIDSQSWVNGIPKGSPSAYTLGYLVRRLCDVFVTLSFANDNSR